MGTSVILIFDIGKTNKKFFLFDEDLKVIVNQSRSFDEIPDDDGFLSEDLNALVNWIRTIVTRIVSNPLYDVKTINFSTYGASLVHLDKNGEVIAPFYNYLKPFPEEHKHSFLKKYNAENQFSLTSASPFMGFLNSGLQLYYLKKAKSKLFKNLYQSLHFPQYLSYLFTGKICSEYTSLGCHTGLWDFKNDTYAQWVKEEGFEKYLAPIQASSKVFPTSINGKSINIGIGVHDSSAALIPYIQKSAEPFVLISTGTWNICMNPFNNEPLKNVELQNDCLNFLGIMGDSIKASRVFLGQEHADQVKLLSEYFNSDKEHYKSIIYDDDFVSMNNQGQLLFKYIHLNSDRIGFKEAESTDYSEFKNFSQAYHQLIHELTEIQIASLKLALGKTQIRTVFIDGGFSGNDVFVGMLIKKLPEYDIQIGNFKNGSALGAAMVVST